MSPNALRVLPLSMASVLVLATSAFAAPPIASTFDTDLDGWTTSGPGGVVYQSAGGNPGGYAQFLRAASSPDTVAVAPPKFTGNLSAYDGQIISFDAGGAPSQAGTAEPSFGLIDIYYSGLPTPISQDIAPGIPGLPFQTYSGPFTAAGFGVSPATWSTAIANIDSITIDISTYVPVSANSPVSVDNVMISPEPTSLALLALGACALLRRRRTLNPA